MSKYINVNYLFYFRGYFRSFICIHFIGTDIKEKSKPRIKINIPPIVKDSHIILFNKHLHHGL